MKRGKRRESALEARCVRWARARGIQVSKNAELIGVPDRTFWLPGGRPMVPEFKRPDGAGRTASAQDWHLARLLECGYDAPVIDSWEGFLTAMRRRGVK